MQPHGLCCSFHDLIFVENPLPESVREFDYRPGHHERQSRGKIRHELQRDLQLVEKMRKGAPEVSCVSCNKCLATTVKNEPIKCSCGK